MTFSAIAVRLKDIASLVADTAAQIANNVAKLAAAHPVAALAVGLGVLGVAIVAATKA